MPKSTMPETNMPKTNPIDDLARYHEAMLPKEFGGAVNLFIHPIAASAAFSALGLGMASQAFGMWMGTVAGAAEASRRMMEGVGETASSADKAAKGSRLELVSSNDAPRAAAAAMRTAGAEIERFVEKASRTAQDIAEDAIRDADKVAEIAKTVSRTAQPKTTATPKVKAKSGPTKPRGIGKPEIVDDLKAISGVGPKLEQVLNKLGIWTYGQIASLSEPEIAWLDQELGFSGRIGRDDWTGQAKAFADR